MTETERETFPPAKLLLGPGPSNVHPRVYQAMIGPVLGHLDPDFLTIMDDVKERLRYLFQTGNDFTIAISGTGMSGMEAAICNVVEPGDVVLVCVAGAFGGRMAEIVKRCGGELHKVEAEWGNTIEPGAVVEAIKCHRPKLVAIVNAETSTGAWQPLEKIGLAAKEHDALFLVDTVTSLGGCPVKVDEWNIDICYSGTQKCIGAPPGLAPITFNSRAMERVKRRNSPVQSFYLDVTLLEEYWGEKRAYHHTAPVSSIYALREALEIIQEEGLEERHRRHERNHRALAAGLNAMGLQLLPPEGRRLWMLNAIKVPEGVSEASVRGRLLKEFNIEVGAGLGPLKGKIWRMGLMGYNSTENTVFLFLAALEHTLKTEGFSVKPGAGLEAAGKAYSEE